VGGRRPREVVFPRKKRNRRFGKRVASFAPFEKI
jgi:hypothetical protein